MSGLLRYSADRLPPPRMQREQLTVLESLFANPKFVRALEDMRKARTEVEAAAWKRVRTTRGELATLAVVLAVWVFSGYIMALAGVFVAMRAPSGAKIGVSDSDLRLPDLGFDLMRNVWLPEFSADPASALGGYNVVMTFIGAFTTMRIVFHEERVIIFRRMLIVHSVICLVRSAFILMTSLPDPYGSCHEFADTKHPLIQAAYRAATLGFTACGDVFFSGHMAMCVMCAKIWQTYTHDRLWKVLISLLVLLEALYMLKLQFHYTIDIFVGSYLSSRVYDSFHTSWSPLFEWLEDSPFVLATSNEDVITWLSRCPPVTEISMQLQSLTPDSLKLRQRAMSDAPSTSRPTPPDDPAASSTPTMQVARNVKKKLSLVDDVQPAGDDLRKRRQAIHPLLIATD